MRTGALAILAHLVAVWAQASVGTAAAQAGATVGPLRVPSAVILYVHPEVTDRSFVEPLLCALERVLVAPVSTRDLQFPLGSDLNATRSQLDVDKVAGRFRQATAADGDDLTFKHLVVARDMTVRPYNYLFASTYGIEGEATPLQVISTARLAPPTTGPTAGDGVALTVQRLYKVVLRSIVQNTGHFNLTGCVMASPNSLADHDRKPAALCPADRARLVQQGVLRERETDSCQAVAGLRARAAVALLSLGEASRSR
jgi:predicted Zn-dependent protease